METYPSEQNEHPSAESDLADITYVLASKTGYGHSSRAVAILRELDQPTNVLFAANNNVHKFIDYNLKDTQVRHGYMPVHYRPQHTAEWFTANNKDLVHVAAESPLVVNDYLKQFRFLGDALRRTRHDQLYIGIYHSIEGYSTDDFMIKKYQETYKDTARSLDYLFLVEPKVEHAAPYELAGGAMVIPTDPVVRQITKEPAEVRRDIGLEPDEDFILVQSGMSGNRYLREFVASLAELSLRGLRLVLVPSRMQIDADMMREAGITVIPNAMDANNLVNAAAGVIAKPGMQIVSEAIGYRRPLLLVDDPSPEPKLKITMVQEVVGPDLPAKLDVEANICSQISEWAQAAPEISAAYSRIPCDGARQIARLLPELRDSLAMSNTA